MASSKRQSRAVRLAVNPPADPADLKRVLRRSQLTLDELAAKLDRSRGAVLDGLDQLKASGANLVCLGGLYSIHREPEPLEATPDHHLVSDAKGRYRFGVISDTHLGSKHCRLDVVDGLYDWFAAEGVRKVYHAGNWIDGEARFNKFELIDEAHGMQSQLDYMISRYPRKRGITTYYVTGDDHEGWYAQREGVDPGRLLQLCAEKVGRRDLRNMGYMEAFITLEHAKTGHTSKMLLCHPGGGSAYAVSYAPQKIAESWQPGEKPGVALFGHYHKLEYLVTRGVHVIQAGCTKEVDAWARKRRLSYHIGGWIVELWQDPQGAISRCRPEAHTWYDRGYYNFQWNPAGKVEKVRAPHGRKRARKA